MTWTSGMTLSVVGLCLDIGGAVLLVAGEVRVAGAILRTTYRDDAEGRADFRRMLRKKRWPARIALRFTRFACRDPYPILSAPSAQVVRRGLRDGGYSYCPRQGR